jgi:ABC-2 type transport system ATP-binding protein
MGFEAPPALAIEGLCVRYGERPALENVALTVRQHEILGLAGRRGAGKSTLLKSVLMLLAPHAGTIRVFGAPHHLAGSRTRLAYLPERFQPPGHLSGHDFVRLTLAFHGRPAKRARTALMAEQVELDPAALNRQIRGYAKSLIQKLGLLAIMLTDLPFLVLDEPLSGLDPGARRLLKRQLAAYRARGRTILLGARIPSDHEALCDRVAVLERGRLCDLGAPDELKARHRAATLASALVAATADPPREPARRSAAEASHLADPDLAGGAAVN